MWKKYPRLMSYFQRHKSAVKFALSGCITGTLDLVFLFILHGVFGVEVITATSISFVLCFILSFYLQKVWAFRVRDNKGTFRQMAIYFANGFLVLNYNGILMHLFVHVFGVWYILSQLLVNITIGIGNYIFSRFIVFRKKI